ncbi:MAG: 3-phosphoshikimate 1-carboxyvinyltransferase [Paramuribaculum sp.]|nr:3-phosphoshikimate 1-carboxyvinyltransferase [Paramuribaculum sp.]
MDYRIFPPEDLLQARVKLPLSKSVSNRALMLNALTTDPLPLKEVADCDDTKAMMAGLGKTDGSVNVGAAGTAMRFLTAYYAAQPGCEVVLDGSERMRQRPIGELVDALKACGASIEYEGQEGFPPLKIKGNRLNGGSITIRSDVSSQFISALLMVGPLMENGLTVTLEGEIKSLPYIRMTIEMMKIWGADAEMEGNEIRIKKGQYQATDFTVEGDWSAASYWYEIEALTSGWVTLDGLQRFSLQGDSRVIRLYENLGVNTEFDGEEGGVDLVASPDGVPRFIADMSDTPDLTQTVVVTCAMLGIPFRLTGVASLRIKETDRIEALKTELYRVGIVLEIESDDIISWEDERCPVREMPVFDTYDDHRMALSFAPVALFIPGIIIRNADVVSKSYPGYWDDLKNAGFKVEEVTATAEAPLGENETEDQA